MNIVKECSYDCKMIGCKYSCINTSKEMNTNVTTIYKCYEYSCREIFINQNEFNKHIQNHVRQIRKVFQLIGEKSNYNIKFLPPLTVKYSTY